jgi:thioredoxin 1
MAVQNLNVDGLKDFNQAEKLTIIDFWADWCAPCKTLAPLLDSLAQKYEGVIKFAKVNISNDAKGCAEYSITNIPCLIVFRDGKEVDRQVGFKGKEGVEGLILKHTQGS